MPGNADDPVARVPVLFLIECSLATVRTEGDLLVQGQNSQTKFQSVTLHVERY